MTEAILAKRDPNRAPTHPGAILSDMLDDTGTTRTAFARNIGISRQQLHDILTGRRPVSRDIAAKIGKAAGNGPGLWLRMQAAFDAWHAEREVDVSGIETIAAPAG